MQFVFYATALSILNQLDSWKRIVSYLCTCAEKRTQLQKIGKNLEKFGKKNL